MVIKYASKRDKNGNRYYLEVDTDKNIFGRVASHWFCREDFIEVSKKDLHKLESIYVKAGFVEVYHI